MTESEIEKIEIDARKHQHPQLLSGTIVDSKKLAALCAMSRWALTAKEALEPFANILPNISDERLVRETKGNWAPSVSGVDLNRARAAIKTYPGDKP